MERATEAVEERHEEAEVGLFPGVVDGVVPAGTRKRSIS
jgi:hypothetical protein